MTKTILTMKPSRLQDSDEQNYSQVAWNKQKNQLHK